MKLVRAGHPPCRDFPPLHFVPRMMRRVPAHCHAYPDSAQRRNPPPPIAQVHPQPSIACGSGEPQQADRMRQQNHRSKHQRRNDSLAFPGPNQCQRKASKPDRQVIVHETQVEDVPIRQHRDARGEEPRRLPRNHLHQRKYPPEKHQHTQRHREFLGQPETAELREIQQQNIEQHVIPLPHEIQPWRLALLHQLREPRVVNVATQISGLDIPVPIAGDQHHCGNHEDAQHLAANKSELRFFDLRFRCGSFRSHSAVF